MKEIKCKYVRRFGEGCRLNNNCKFPDCQPSMNSKKKKAYKITDKKRKVVLDYYYNNHDNRDSVIAKAVNVSPFQVAKITQEESDRCIAKVNERIRIEDLKLKDMELWKKLTI